MNTTRRKPKGEKNMNKERENIEILHTPPHVSSHARVHETPSAKLQNSEATLPACLYCRFFSCHSINASDESGTDPDLPGECRMHPPQVGDLIKRGTDDEERWFGNFPIVMAGDWCGQFQPRH